jgi:hypothetical protein
MASQPSLWLHQPLATAAYVQPSKWLAKPMANPADGRNTQRPGQHMARTDHDHFSPRLDQTMLRSAQRPNNRPPRQWPEERMASPAHGKPSDGKRRPCPAYPMAKPGHVQPSQLPDQPKASPAHGQHTARLRLALSTARPAHEQTSPRSAQPMPTPTPFVDKPCPLPDQGTDSPAHGKRPRPAQPVQAHSLT